MKKTFTLKQRKAYGPIRYILTVISLVTSFLLTACATSSDIDMLKYDISRLQRDSQATREEINTLKENTAGVAKEESFHVLRQSLAEQQSLVANLLSDIQILKGRFDENKYFIEKTFNQWTGETDLLKTQIVSLEGRIQEMKKRLDGLEEHYREGSAEQTGVSGELESADGKPSRNSIPTDKKSRYEDAYSAFIQKRYKDARDKFEAFVRDYPKDELTDNAYFWIGETYFGEKDYEGAILAYETFLKKYLNSPKAPSAMYKQGICFLEIKDNKTGKVILEQVLERYPKSKEAEYAKNKLNELNEKPTKKKQ